MEWTQTEKAKEPSQEVATTAASSAPAKKGDKKSVHISELSVQQLQNIGRKYSKVLDSSCKDVGLKPYKASECNLKLYIRN